MPTTRTGRSGRSLRAAAPGARARSAGTDTAHRKLSTGAPAVLGALALLGHGLLGREPHRLHPAFVDLDHLELAAVDGDGVPGPRDAAQLRHEEAAHRLVAAG